jgi:hypothetical protein
MCIISTQTVYSVNLRYSLHSQHIGEVEESFSPWEYQHQTDETGQLYIKKIKIKKLM